MKMKLWLQGVTAIIHVFKRIFPKSQSTALWDLAQDMSKIWKLWERLVLRLNIQQLPVDSQGKDATQGICLDEIRDWINIMYNLYNIMSIRFYRWWRRNVLVTSLRCWWPIWWSCHQLFKSVIIKSSPFLLSPIYLTHRFDRFPIVSGRYLDVTLNYSSSKLIYNEDHVNVHYQAFKVIRSSKLEVISLPT